MSKVTRLLNQARRWQYQVPEVGAKVKKLNAEELEDFIVALKDEISMCGQKAEKYQEDLEKGKARQAKLEVKYAAIISELDKLPDEPPHYDAQGNRLARGYRYHQHDHTLSDKDLSVLERHKKGEDKLFRLEQMKDSIKYVEGRLNEILKIAEGGEIQPIEYTGAQSTPRSPLDEADSFMEQLSKLSGSNIFGARK